MFSSIQDDRQYGTEKIDGPDQFDALGGMLADDLEFFRRQLAGLGQDIVRDIDGSRVAQHAGIIQVVDLFLADGELLCQGFDDLKIYRSMRGKRRMALALEQFADEPDAPQDDLLLVLIELNV